MSDNHENTQSNVPDHEPDENRVERTINSFTDRIADLFRQGNRRRLELNNAEGKRIFSLPLIVVVLIGLFLLWRVPVLLVIAVVVALVLKMQFVLTREHDVEIVEPDSE